MTRTDASADVRHETIGLTRRALVGGAGKLAAGGALLATPAAALAGTKTAAGCVTPTPAGFRKFLVYVAEGTAGAITDSDAVLAYQLEVYGRDAAAVAAYVEQAKAFFLRRFGLDFRRAKAPTPTGPWVIDGATLQGGFLSPARGYTAYVVSEEFVGSDGWKVRDSSFNVTITKDQVLHGTWGGAAGKPAKAGSFVTFGDYNIDVQRAGRSEDADARDGDILIHFESGSPIVGDVDGTLHFVCDLAHVEWGPGHARGIVTTDGGIRNVLTFPPALP